MIDDVVMPEQPKNNMWMKILNGIWIPFSDLLFVHLAVFIILGAMSLLFPGFIEDITSYDFITHMLVPIALILSGLKQLKYWWRVE